MRLLMNNGPTFKGDLIVVIWAVKKQSMPSLISILPLF